MNAGVQIHIFREYSPHVSDDTRSFWDEEPVGINVFRGDVGQRFFHISQCSKISKDA